MRSIKNVEKKDWIFFLVGIILSVLFAVFSADIYEMLYYEPEFSNEMYNQGLYNLAAIITLASCWGVGILYYLVLEHVFTCDRWYHWLISIFIVLALAPTVAFYNIDGFMQERNLDFMLQEQNFAIASVGVSFVLYMIVCFALKSLSLNNSKTPF